MTYKWWFPGDVHELRHWLAEVCTESVLASQTPWPGMLLPALSFFPSPPAVLGGKVELPASWVFECFTPVYFKLLQKAAEVHKYWALRSVWVEFPLGRNCFTWLFLRLFGKKDFIGRETCFKRHKVTPLGALLSEIGSKENNRSYSSRLWAQVQTQTIALDQTRALSRNIARFRKKNWLQIETWASELRACLNTCFRPYDSLHFVQTAYRQAAAGCCWVHWVMC